MGSIVYSPGMKDCVPKVWSTGKNGLQIELFKVPLNSSSRVGFRVDRLIAVAGTAGLVVA
jgi:hypothetical protein